MTSLEGDHSNVTGSVVILRPVDRRRMHTKTYAVASNVQVVRQDFSDAKYFKLELAQANGIDALHRLLLELKFAAAPSDAGSRLCDRVVRDGNGCERQSRATKIPEAGG